MKRDFDTDVFVVGAGPAGLTTAIAARRKGLRVAVADPAAFPIDKACGEGLLPGALAALQTLGAFVPAVTGVPFRGIRFLDRGFSIEASFPAGQAGLGIRRTHLHRILEERARALRVEFHCDARVTGLASESAREAAPENFRRGVRINGHTVSARWIVGADGQHSQVRRWAGLASKRFSLRYGFRRHFAVQPWSQHVEVYWGDHCQAYVTPVSETEVCVAFLTRHAQLRLPEGLALFPALASRLRNASAAKEAGGVSAVQSVRRVFSGNVALVGDASGSVDAVTGDGLRLAFEQAIALADALECGDLSAYGKKHRTLSRRAGRMSRLLLLLNEYRGVRRRAFAAFAAQPELFAKLLAFHAAQPSRASPIGSFAALGWKMAIAPHL